MSVGARVAMAVGMRVLFAGDVDVHVHILARCGRKCTSLGVHGTGRGAGSQPPMRVAHA
jgi:hypothetical protein